MSKVYDSANWTGPQTPIFRAEVAGYLVVGSSLHIPEDAVLPACLLALFLGLSASAVALASVAAIVTAIVPWYA